MSVKRIIQESIEKNPLGVKEALEEALQERILVALEEKYKKMAMESDDEDEDDDEDDEDEDDEDEDMDESLDLDEETLDFIDVMLDEGYDLDDAINAIVEQELEEGSIKGSGTDRKAQLKKAYRAGEQKTRDFYKNKFTSAPRTADKGVKKAFAAGQGAGDGSPTAQGSKRSSSQDSLKGTKHDQSSVSPTSKSFRSTHSTKMYGLRKKPNLPESFDLSDYTVEELEDFMMSEDFDQLDEISKKTLASYVKKAGGAGKEGLAHAVKSQMSAADSGDRAGYKKSQRQANNRSTGIQRAADRLAK